MKENTSLTRRRKGISAPADGSVAVYDPEETHAIAVLRHEAVKDYCCAALTKASMDNAALLYAVAARHVQEAPESAQALDYLTRNYVHRAVRRIQDME